MWVVSVETIAGYGVAARNEVPNGEGTSRRALGTDGPGRSRHDRERDREERLPTRSPQILQTFHQFPPLTIASVFGLSTQAPEKEGRKKKGHSPLPFEWGSVSGPNFLRPLLRFSVSRACDSFGAVRETSPSRSDQPSATFARHVPAVHRRYKARTRAETLTSR